VNRRSFIALIGGTAAWPLAARGQEAGRTYRLGFLTQVGRNTPGIVAFFDELRAHGFVEGRNLSMIPGGFGVAIERIGEVAETMVKAAPDAIVAGPELPLRALQTLTRTIPLIGMTEDMVAEGFAASLARPGGNITGISLLSPELDGKRQDILIEAVPGVRRMAALADANVTPALSRSPRRRRSCRRSTRQRRPVPKPSTFWRRRCSSSTAVSPSSAPPWCICPQSINGPKWRKKAASSATDHGLPRCIGKERRWS
jgi:putative ABC transport system substrate-binding protein